MDRAGRLLAIPSLCGVTMPNARWLRLVRCGSPRCRRSCSGAATTVAKTVGTSRWSDRIPGSVSGAVGRATSLGAAPAPAARLRWSSRRPSAGPSHQGPSRRGIGPVAPCVACIAKALCFRSAAATLGTSSICRAPSGCVVRAQSPSTARGAPVVSGSGLGPEFSVPFVPVGGDAGPVERDSVDMVEACFLEASEDVWRMEAELTCAVLVTV